MKYLDLIHSDRACPFDAPLPRDVVTENATAYVTYSLASYHPDQLLIIPKRHVTRMDELTAQELLDCDNLQKIGLLLLKELGHGGISIVLREGTSSGKSVPHLHYNLIPDTRLGDMDAHGEEKRDIMTEAEIVATMSRMRDALAKSPPYEPAT